MYIVQLAADGVWYQYCVYELALWEQVVFMEYWEVRYVLVYKRWSLDLVLEFCDDHRPTQTTGREGAAMY